MGRRNWVALDRFNTRCVVVEKRRIVRLSAYEMTAARNATARDLAYSYGAPSDAISRAHVVRRLLDGEGCYAFHCKAAGRVKIGRTGNLFRRWAALETQGGRVLQLLAFWPDTNSRDRELFLHKQFEECRELGEWFAAGPVVNHLRNLLEKED